MCAVICKGVRIMTASKTSWETTEKAVYEISFRGGVKKQRIFYGQADRMRLSPHPPLTVSFLWFVLVFFCPYILIICVLKRISHMKKVIFIQLLESPIPPLTDAALRTIICKSSATSRWSFARGRSLRMIICKRPSLRMINCKKPAPPDDHLQEADPSGWSFSRGLSLRMIICKRPPDNHLQEAGLSG